MGRIRKTTRILNLHFHIILNSTASTIPSTVQLPFQTLQLYPISLCSVIKEEIQTLFRARV